MPEEKTKFVLDLQSVKDCLDLMEFLNKGVDNQSLCETVMEKVENGDTLEEIFEELGYNCQLCSENLPL